MGRIDVFSHSTVIKNIIQEFDKPIKIAEIGVHLGRNARYLLREVGDKILEYWGVDKYDTAAPSGITFNRKNNTMEKWDEVYLSACKYMPFFPQFRILRIKSNKAPSMFQKRYFPKGYFDFIYIDADHTYESVKDDIHSWYPLVFAGGLIGGHDYGFPPEVVKYNGVQKAVDEIFGVENIKVYHDQGVWLVRKTKDTVYNKV